MSLGIMPVYVEKMIIVVVWGLGTRYCGVGTGYCGVRTGNQAILLNPNITLLQAKDWG